MTTILIITYIIGALVSWPFIARYIGEDDYSQMDRVMSMGVGFAMSLFWPLLIPGYFLVRIVYKVAFPTKKRSN